jgi:hypothetical protein
LAHQPLDIAQRSGLLGEASQAESAANLAQGIAQALAPLRV